MLVTSISDIVSVQNVLPFALFCCCPLLWSSLSKVPLGHCSNNWARLHLEQNNLIDPTMRERKTAARACNCPSELGFSRACVQALDQFLLLKNQTSYHALSCQAEILPLQESHWTARGWVHHLVSNAAVLSHSSTSPVCTENPKGKCGGIAAQFNPLSNRLSWNS